MNSTRDGATGISSIAQQNTHNPLSLGAQKVVVGELHQELFQQHLVGHQEALPAQLEQLGA